jgi:hypothetical protein
MTVAAPTRAQHPTGTPRPGGWIAADLAPVAAQVVATIRDYDLADVHHILGEVPAERRQELILVLAAMVDPDRTAGELLAWTGRPAISRDDEDWSRPPASKSRGSCHRCGKVMRRDKIARHIRAQHPDDTAQAA